MAVPRKSSISTPPARATPVAPTIPPAATPPAPVVERSEVKGSGKPKAPVATRTPTRQEIEKRAFEIYAGRGYAPGDQNADWLEAERQLKAGL